MLAVEAPLDLKVSWNEEIFEGNERLQECIDK